MKAFDKNGKMHTISSKDVDSIEHWKKSLQVAGYNPKNEELHPRDVPHLKKMIKDGSSDEDIRKMHPKLTDYELEKLKESVIDPKEVKEEDAYDNDRFIIKNGKATVDNSNTADKSNHVHAPNAKTAVAMYKAGVKSYKDTTDMRKKFPMAVEEVINEIGSFSKIYTKNQWVLILVKRLKMFSIKV